MTSISGSRSTDLQLAMSRNEQALFLSCLRCCRRYLEFGSGGSTCAAALVVAESVISVDSSKDWLQSVEDACKSVNVKAQPLLMHVDIGELKEWGYPKNDLRRADWPKYHSQVWELEESKQAEFYLVDGRFRVACFLQIISRMQRPAPIAVHDFAERPQYHVILQFGDEIARVENMSVFIRKPYVDFGAVHNAMNEYQYNPA